jgi:structural maintenance of chromosome 3 (chondroitin sulfate proteoglycan 6)
VVDTDDTASKVLDVMLKEKTGRVTFMPLNRLKPRNPPTPNADDAIPLIDKLNYSPDHQKAFQQVFGKTCVCRDLTIAAAYVKSHGINTITLDGDKVDRKGALSGGYHDVRRSRIEAIKNVTTWRGKFEAEEKRSKEVKEAILKVDQEITNLAGKLLVLSNQQNQTREGRELLTVEGNNLNNERERLKEKITKLEADVDELEVELGGLEARKVAYEQELRSPLSVGLTAHEEEELESLGQEVERRRKLVVELGKVKNQVCSSHHRMKHAITEYFVAGGPEERYRDRTQRASSA